MQEEQGESTEEITIRVSKKITSQVAAIQDFDQYAKNAMCRNIKEIMTPLCTFCDGRGHHAKQCGTKKLMDECFSKLPAQKKYWGFVKNNKRINGKTVGIQRTAKASIAMIEAAISKMV